MPTRTSDAPPLGRGALLIRLALIGAVLGSVIIAFAWTGGFLSPHAVTPAKFIDTFVAASGPHPGFRSNHAKGVCFTGYFEGSGEGTRYSKAIVFEKIRTPIVGRFALAGGQPYAADAERTVRSMALRFELANGEDWRAGMNNVPVFVVSTPAAFYEQLTAGAPDPKTGKPDPAKMKAFVDAHPETARAIAIVKAHAVSSGFGDETYNSINAFRFVDAHGRSTPVRWSAVPVQPSRPAPADAPAPTDKNALFDAFVADVASHPLQWHLVATIAKAGDPVNDATQAWPDDREHVDLGTVTVDRAESEDAGYCRDINYDPLVLPSGIEASDDPLLSARSAVYSRSFRRRAGEDKPASAVSVPGNPRMEATP
ncbi:MAG: catalase family peroxidase [Rhodanobacteraceae bacterium]